MNNDYDEIYDLIARSFSGELTDQETELLNSWKSSMAANLKEYNDMKIIWTKSGQMALPSGIDLQKLLAVTRKKAGIKNNQNDWRRFFIQVAALLMVVVIFSTLYNAFVINVGEKSAAVIYQEVKASYGTQCIVELSDGTVVHLNSGSTLRFPISFGNRKDRKVGLSGEGYFVVSKRNEPFIVDLHKMEIRVTGTTFNVEAYPENSAITVALVEGEVQLQQPNGEKTSTMMEMKPNQVAIFRQAENKLQWKTENDLEKYTAWTEGKIVFSNDPVNTVIRKLANWYNVDIELSDPGLKKYRFTGTFIDEPLEQVLTILNLTSKMSYVTIPAVKQGDNSYTKRKIILKSH